jgi:hypothetical protein
MSRGSVTQARVPRCGASASSGRLTECSRIATCGGLFEFHQPSSEAGCAAVGAAIGGAFLVTGTEGAAGCGDAGPDDRAELSWSGRRVPAIAWSWTAARERSAAGCSPAPSDQPCRDSMIWAGRAADDESPSRNGPGSSPWSRPCRGGGCGGNPQENCGPSTSPGRPSGHWILWLRPRGLEAHITCGQPAPLGAGLAALHASTRQRAATEPPGGVLGAEQRAPCTTTRSRPGTDAMTSSMY